MIIKVYKLTRNFYKKAKRNAISAHASEAAFFLFLSIIPGVVSVFALISLASISESSLINLVIKITPNMFEPFIISLINEVYNQSAIIILLTALFAIWAATKAAHAIMRALNVINGVTETRNYIILQVKAWMYTVILLGLIIISLIIMVSGNILVELLLKDIPYLKSFFDLVMSFRFLFTWMILTGFFMLFYTFIPNKKVSFFMQFQGAFWASVIWSALAGGFSIYIEHFNSFDMYGSLATIVMLMLWLYTSMYILLLGAMLNRYYKPTAKRNLLTFMMLLTIMFIWGNSILPASISGEISNHFKIFIGEILRNLEPTIGELDISISIRKIAHFTEFLFLGVVITWCFFPKSIKALIILPLSGLAIALVDETIQKFSEGRAYMIRDIGIDFLGFCVGFIMVMIVGTIWNIIIRRKQH